MPLYEYQCNACGHLYEVIRKFSDPPEDTCPKCGGVVRKVQSAPAFQFKGTGWYVTDYAKSGQAEAKADGKDGRKSETKSDGDGKKGSASDTSAKSESTPGTSSSPAPPAASGSSASKSGD